MCNGNQFLVEKEISEIEYRERERKVEHNTKIIHDIQ